MEMLPKVFLPLSNDELANCMERIAFNSDLKKKKIELGKIQSEKFSWEKCAKETLSVYNKFV